MTQGQDEQVTLVDSVMVVSFMIMIGVVAAFGDMSEHVEQQVAHVLVTELVKDLLPAPF